MEACSLRTPAPLDVRMRVVVSIAALAQASFRMELPFGSDFLDMPVLSYVTAAAETTLRALDVRNKINEQERQRQRQVTGTSDPDEKREQQQHTSSGMAA